MDENSKSDIDPQTGWSRVVARQIGRSVMIAGGLKKRTWAIMDGHPGVHVNIGQRNAIEMDDKHVRLLVDLRYFPVGKLSAANRLLDWRDNNDEKASGLRKIEFWTSDAERELRKMQTAHEMAVRLVSDKRTPFEDRHDKGVVGQLERISEMTFPRLDH